jgi:hypothetical protein
VTGPEEEPVRAKQHADSQEAQHLIDTVSLKDRYQDAG